MPKGNGKLFQDLQYKAVPEQGSLQNPDLRLMHKPPGLQQCHAIWSARNDCQQVTMNPGYVC